MANLELARFNELSIRLTTNDDVQQLEELIHPILKENGFEPEPEKTDFDIRNVELNFFNLGGEFFAAVDSADKIVGSCGYAPLSRTEVEIHKLYVAKQWRGKKLGRYLIELCIRRIKLKGWKRISVETHKSLIEAVNLYKSVGFVLRNEPVCAERADAKYVLEL